MPAVWLLPPSSFPPPIPQALLIHLHSSVCCWYVSLLSLFHYSANPFFVIISPIKLISVFTFVVSCMHFMTQCLFSYDVPNNISPSPPFAFFIFLLACKIPEKLGGSLQIKRFQCCCEPLKAQIFYPHCYQHLVEEITSVADHFFS